MSHPDDHNCPHRSRRKARRQVTAPKAAGAAQSRLQGGRGIFDSAELGTWNQSGASIPDIQLMCILANLPRSDRKVPPSLPLSMDYDSVTEKSPKNFLNSCPFKNNYFHKLLSIRLKRYFHSEIKKR